MSSKNWTTKNIQDLTGKTVIVTGGNSGLGLEAVKAFANKNAKVILTSRTIDKGEIAKQKILQQYPNADITVFQLDLADLSSIKSFAVKMDQSLDNLDILLNNAGIMLTPYQLTKDGFENQFGTNHLGHFALTGLLMSLLKATPKSRVVNVSSMAHKQGKMDFDNLHSIKDKNYNSANAYRNSKLANLLFTFELQRYFTANNIDSIAVAAHPGVSNTNLFQHISNKAIMKLLRPAFQLFTQPAHMGVLPELRAATDVLAKGGDYYGPEKMHEIKGFPVLVKPGKNALDLDSAKKLWVVSEELTRIIYK